MRGQINEENIMYVNDNAVTDDGDGGLSWSEKGGRVYNYAGYNT